MVTDVSDLQEALQILLAQHIGKLPIIEAICSGRMSRDQVRAIAVRQYAETRVALQVKLPERLRICPISAEVARSYWCQQLADESGGFERGHDHATLFAPICIALGATQEECDSAYQAHLPRVSYLCESPVSMELTLCEATSVFVEESVLSRDANRIGNALREFYDVPEETLLYFRLHAEVDIAHSAAALEMLNSCAKTQAQKELVLTTAEAALKQFPNWASDLMN